MQGASFFVEYACLQSGQNCVVVSLRQVRGEVEPRLTPMSSGRKEEEQEGGVDDKNLTKSLFPESDTATNNGEFNGNVQNNEEPCDGNFLPLKRSETPPPANKRRKT